jgi:hypothetical protein
MMQNPDTQNTIMNGVAEELENRGFGVDLRGQIAEITLSSAQLATLREADPEIAALTSARPGRWLYIGVARNPSQGSKRVVIQYDGTDVVYMKI